MKKYDMFKKANKQFKIICKIVFIITIIIIIYLNFNYSYMEDMEKFNILEEQELQFNIKGFLDKSKEYSRDIFEGNEIEEVFKNVVKGKVENRTIIKKITDIFFKEIKDNFINVATIFSIIIIHSILKTISDGLENSEISKLMYYVEYIMIVTVIMDNFVGIIKLVEGTIKDLSMFTNLLIPLLMTFIIYTGNIAVTSMIQPIILFMINFISIFIRRFILPLTLIYTTFMLISKLTDRIEIENISKTFKSSINWILTTILVVFVSVLSLEGTLASSIDGVTLKTTKSVVSSTVPVVGKILGDAVDSIFGATNILKNAAGILGVIIIVGICIRPIMKLFIIMMLYRILIIIVEPICDKKIVGILENISEIFKILMAIIITISVLFIIGTSLILKISNISMMYR